ncbi:MAG: hypothetical protein JNL79_05785 [Myxococcales bacterium]|nr:hypothetical protein [Myxococcales bacterium]
MSPYRRSNSGWVCGCARAAEPLGVCAECGDLVCVECVRLGRAIYRCEACLHRRPPWLPRLLVAIHAFNALVYATGLPILALRSYGEPVARPVTASDFPGPPAKISVMTMRVVWPRPYCPCSTNAGIARRRCCIEGVLP